MVLGRGLWINQLRFSKPVFLGCWGMESHKGQGIGRSCAGANREAVTAEL